MTEVLRTPRLSLGPRLEAFEQALAAYVGVAQAVAVSSGTAALHLCLRALGIGPGDEVIVPSFAFIAVANAVRYVQAIPVFADIEAATLNLDPARAEAAITPKTRAIIVVHTFGVPADLAALGDIARQHGLLLIEDACEALGSECEGRPVGSFGDAAVFGFYPNKQLTTGEGGAVVVRDRAVAGAVRSLRNQGREDEGRGSLHEAIGYNYRLPEMNCALGLEQLKRIEEIVATRESIARRYRALLEGNSDIELPAACGPRDRISWFAFVVRVAQHRTQRRDRLIEQMTARGIACGRYFQPIHLQPAWRDEPHRSAGLDVTVAQAQRTIALPFFNRITDAQVEEVALALAELAANLR